MIFTLILFTLARVSFSCEQYFSEKEVIKTFLINKKHKFKLITTHSNSEAIVTPSGAIWIRALMSNQFKATHTEEWDNNKGKLYSLDTGGAEAACEKLGGKLPSEKDFEDLFKFFSKKSGRNESFAPELSKRGVHEFSMVFGGLNSTKVRCGFITSFFGVSSCTPEYRYFALNGLSYNAYVDGDVEFPIFNALCILRSASE